MERKKKLRFIQLGLLFLGIVTIIFTYTNKSNRVEERIITKETQKKIQEQLSQKKENSDVFYNIEYSGLDLAGNRYILKSAEATNSKTNREIVFMKSVEAFFYFKDDTVLYVWSDKGIYNNNTLDMMFEGNVKANYEGSELNAQKAEYSNSKSFLTISDRVKVKDVRGTLYADKLLFDIKNEKLSIASFNNGKVNANINIK